MSILADGPLALVILDGWGIGPAGPSNAITSANTPFYDDICRRYSSTHLAAAGESVGLTAEAPGNAEVGHLCLGAGRSVKSEAVRIGEAIQNGTFFENTSLDATIRATAEQKTGLHLIGLLSDAGTNSSTEALYALLRMAKRAGAENVFVHAILDGRDVPARTADVYVEALELKMADIGVGRIASLCGRFFAMDGAGNWERTARYYTMLVHADGERAPDPLAAVRRAFLRGFADEFVSPIVIEDEGRPAATIRDGDAVIFFNHRPEGMKQLVASLAGKEGADRRPMVGAVCMVEYDRGFGLPVAFPPDRQAVSLGSVLAANGVANFRIAEDHRFAHVTQIINLGVESAGSAERHIAVSASNRTLADVEPEMESFKVADRFLRTLEAARSGVFMVNLSAADLAAETGDPKRTVEAVQFADTCLGGIVEGVLEAGGTAIVTSSHSGCENVAGTGGSGTNVRWNDVPFHLVGGGTKNVALRRGSLADVAPTMLGLLNIEKPEKMAGSDLRVS